MKSLINFFLIKTINHENQQLYRQARLIVICALIMAIVDILYVIISYFSDFPEGVVALSIAFSLYVTNAFLFRTNLSNNFLGNMFCAIFYLVVMALGFYTGAIRNHSIILPWLTIVPAIALLFTNRTSAWTWFVICVIGFTGLSLLDKESTPILYNMDYDGLVTVLLYSGLVLVALIINSVFEANKSQAMSALEKAHENIKDQHKELDEKNNKIFASINYSKRIQNAILPGEEKVKKVIPSSFIFFKPKDIVSGDFYWIEQKDNKLFIAAVDCTGHGVPGAFMSLIGNNILHEIITSGITSPNNILDVLHEGVSRVLQQDKTHNEDGMDMSICVFDQKTNMVEFAGAKNPLIYIQENEEGIPELTKIKGDRQCIGGSSKNRKPFVSHSIGIKKPTYLYIFSDGFQDQFGGEKGGKFMIKQMQELFLKIYNLEPANQEAYINKTLTNWMGSNEKQIDDILIVGFKLEPIHTRVEALKASTYSPEMS